VHRSSLARAYAASVAAPARQPLVWLLMGSRAGDNNQLLALANALGFPFEVKKLDFNGLRRITILRNGLTILARRSRELITPPWPDLVLCVGYGSVPVARYIRSQAGGRTKLVHVGNPREPLEDFDLQITTPQYTRGTAPNLLELHFPIGNPARDIRPTGEELHWLDAFPRPRRMIAIGGPARHWELDHSALREAIRRIRSKFPSGSLIVATSPRTRPSTRDLLQSLVAGEHDALVDTFPRFGTLLRHCDEIYVTADSVSMLAEAILSGKPVGMIPIKRSFRGLVTKWLFELPFRRRTLPNFQHFWALLKRHNVVGTVELPVASQVCDTVERAADAVRSLWAPGDDFFDEGRAERTASHMGPARRASR